MNICVIHILCVVSLSNTYISTCTVSIYLHEYSVPYKVLSSPYISSHSLFCTWTGVPRSVEE